jgi:uncharacterized damage-inducible protein DinB
MVNKILSDQIGYSYAMLEKTLDKLTPENIYNRLTENTASAGFLLHHLAETHHSFNRMIFGEPIDFSPKTFRVDSDAGLTFEVEEIKNLMRSGKEKLQAQLNNATTAQLAEPIKTFMGDQTPEYMLFYLLNHNGYHLGQAELALKKGK